MKDLGAAGPSVALPGDDLLAARVLRKVTWRLIPFLALLYIFNILDRANVGFARLTMQGDLGMDREVFDLGYGIFYFGYLLFEVPANLLLHRIGARLWIARIMITWGLVTCATIAVTGPWSFYLVRILLGVAEAGFFPGIILYLTYWFPARERARVIALFMAAIPLAGIVGNPLSGAVMEYFHGTAGLRGWQWLFLIEGLPTVFLGILVLFYLRDGPAQAPWLADEERAWLVERLRQEERAREQREGGALLQWEESEREQRHEGALLRALVDRRVWLLICVYFTVAVGANAAGAHFPRLIKEMWEGPPPLERALGDGLATATGAIPDTYQGVSTLVVGLLSALPPLCAMLGMTLLGAHSDRTGERRGHVAFAAFLAAAGWMLAVLATEPWLGLLGLCVAQTGMMSMLPCFWALPTSFLSGAAAAGGIALINSVANLGGLLGPWILGRFGLEVMAITLCVGGVLVLFAPGESRAPERG
jgi:ACS family tartrate transporter-like MFS transporter